MNPKCCTSYRNFLIEVIGILFMFMVLLGTVKFTFHYHLRISSWRYLLLMVGFYVACVIRCHDYILSLFLLLMFHPYLIIHNLFTLLAYLAHLLSRDTEIRELGHLPYLLQEGGILWNAVWCIRQTLCAPPWDMKPHRGNPLVHWGKLQLWGPQLGSGEYSHSHLWHI